MRLFSLRHEFPTEWATFLGQSPAPNQRFELAVELRPDPFWSQGRLNGVARINLFAQSSNDPVPATLTVADRADQADGGTRKDTLTKTGDLNDLLVGTLSNVPLPPQPTGKLRLYFEDVDLADLWLAITWTG